MGDSLVTGGGVWGQCWAGARSVIRTSDPAPGYSPPGRRWAEAVVTRPGPVNTQTRAHARRGSPATGELQQLYLQHFTRYDFNFLCIVLAEADGTLENFLFWKKIWLYSFYVALYRPLWPECFITVTTRKRKITKMTFYVPMQIALPLGSSCTGFASPDPIYPVCKLF